MISVRFVSVILLLIGSLVIIGQTGVQDLAPAGGNAFFNANYFGDVFSNLIFTFMFHHSLPGITKQLTELKQINQFLRMGFLTAGTTTLIIPITACLAFGNDLIEGRAEALG